ncbi:CPBP family intramembrane glutamic endopeptidase [Brevibacillus sp. HB2.2]|uniref:CPBP family intramembrane glutamic endopeptidase n=1 Tax=Brevibacillus sp. HB2.2 TaxID=2738846 RepID=UPI00156B9C26|nr:CPBP family intramembrane glutamic endopeptidase [Brevibacillus sp. HB2.2]NRS47725.1 CPBP family intramembrane metalloprotease [Brevibacillus sp. HB2.2]
MWTITFRYVTKNPLLLLLLIIMLFLPLLASWGQFLSSGFFGQTVSVSLLFWPKTDWKVAVPLPGWLIFGVISLIYAGGILWLVRGKKLGQAFLFILVGLLLAKAAGAAFQAISGWSTTQPIGAQSLAGKANLLVFATWHNPLWEELVFRGIPFLLLTLIYRRSTDMPTGARWMYLLIPSMIFAYYHVPGHGLGILFESFLIGVLWAWAALRWGLLAPIILHIYADAMIIPSLPKMKNMPLEEIPWLVNQSMLLQSIWALCVLGFLILVLALLIIGWRKARKSY